MQLNSNQIAKILPQSYPFLMIDRVTAFQKGESLTAVKNITGNEWMFDSFAMTVGVNPERRPSATTLGPSRRVEDWHQPMHVFPETLLIEAAAQAALILYHLSKIKDGEKRPRYIWGKTTASFINRVYIGDQLKIVTSATKMFDRLGFMDSRLSVDVVNVADIQIMYSVDKP